MSVVRRLATGIVAMVVVLNPLAIGLADAEEPPPADSQPFLVTRGIVARAEPPAPVHTQFALKCSPVAEPDWAGDPGHSSCQNNEFRIFVSAGTRYFHLEAGVYKPSTYDETIKAGATLRVGGHWAREGFQHYQFHASYIWNPGTGLVDPPQNPQPAIPCPFVEASFCPQDFNYQRRFVVDATVREAGANLVTGAGWSDQWGFVVGAITNYYKNDHVKAIAAAHRDPISLDPQLLITTNDVSSGERYDGTERDPAFANQGLTKFWVQHADGLFHPSTKQQTVIAGAKLRAAGAYGWGPDGDWRFIAMFVWRPAPAMLEGRILFNENAALAETAEDGTAHYEGQSTSGDGQVNPAAVTFDLDWAPDPASDNGSGEFNRWTFTGRWEAVRGGTPAGSVAGSLSGTWQRGSGQTDATVVLETGSGVHCGVSGGGTLSGINPGSKGPTPTFNGSFNIAASRSDCT